jgi:hypothetical protein
MKESDEQRQWRRDAHAPAPLGREFAESNLAPVEVRISRSAAEVAAAEWERTASCRRISSGQFDWADLARDSNSVLNQALAGMTAVRGGRSLVRCCERPR